MACLTARAFKRTIFLIRVFIRSTFFHGKPANDGIKTEASTNYDMDTWEP